MRKNILLLTALIFSMLLFAQEDSRFYENADLIKLLPREGNGYLAWHDNNPDVKYWVVEVDEQRFENWEFTGEKTVWRKEIWKSNYVYIPDGYWSNETKDYRYYTNLIGFGTDDIEVIRTRFGTDGKDANPFTKAECCPPRNIVLGCSWVCEGPDWAYRIQQWKENGMAVYVLEGAGFPTDAGNWVNFFEYMSTDQHTALKGDNDPFWRNWYSISFMDWGPHSSNYPNSPFHKIPNDGSYKDKENAIIEGPDVIRVSKGKGWWKSPFISTDFIIENNECTQQIDGAVIFMNENSNIEELVDDGDLPFMLFCGGGAATGNIENEDCEMAWMGVDYDGDGDVDGFDLLDFILNDMCEGGSPDSDPWDNISFMLAESISNPGNPATELKGEDMFDENGVFTPPLIIIEEGLNRMSVILEGGINRKIVFESKETVQSSFALSNFLDVTIYPVPIVGDEFKINIQSGATLGFTYEMFDFQGELLHSTKYSVKQGHNEDHKVISQKPIPRGLILNRFTFKDGSVLSITTTKD